MRRVAGAIEDDGRPDDIVLPGLAIDAPTDARRRIDDAAIAAALDGADLVIVDNLCSLPLNVEAAARGRARRGAAPRPRAVPPSRPALATAPPRAPRRRPPAARRRRAARDDQPAQPARARGARLRGRDDRSTTSSTSIPAPGDRARHPRAVRLRRRRVRDAATVARDRTQERARRGALRGAPRARMPDRAGAALDRRARPKTATPTRSRAIIERSEVPVTLGRAAQRRRRVRRVRPRRVPVDVGGIRQPGDRVDRGPPRVRGVPLSGARRDPRGRRALLLDRAARRARALPRRARSAPRDLLRREPAPGAHLVLARPTSPARSSRPSPRTAGSSW